MISTFFNYLNFFIVVGLLAYFFKKYMYPLLEKGVHEQKSMIKALKDDYEALKIEQKEVVQSIEIQEARASYFLMTLQRWNQEIMFLNRKRAREKEQLKVALEAKIAQQSHNHREKYLLKELTPQVVDTLEKQLIKEFQSNELAAEYAKKVIEELP